MRFSLLTLWKFLAILSFGIAGSITLSIWKKERVSLPVALASALIASIFSVLVIHWLGLD